MRMGQAEAAEVQAATRGQGQEQAEREAAELSSAQTGMRRLLIPQANDREKR